MVSIFSYATQFSTLQIYGNFFIIPNRFFDFFEMCDDKALSAMSLYPMLILLRGLL